MRKIKLGNGDFFVVNPYNGKWGITRKDSIGELEKKLNQPRQKKEYRGTELFVLNSSNKCNLSCVYCSEKDHRGMTPKMPLETAYKILEKLLKEKEFSKIVFHGSEPTCNFDWIKDVVKYGREMMTHGPNKLQFSIQSNLSSLPKDFIDFIQEYKVGVSTSIDGTREIHNITRPYTNGYPSFDEIIKNARKILAVQGSLNVTTVVTKYNVKFLRDTHDFLEGEGITSWQTIPVQGNPPLSPDSLVLANSYIGLFNRIFDRIYSREQTLEVRTLSQYMASMFNSNGIDACRTCSSGNMQPLVAIDHDGEVYPCDYFWGNENARMGNIHSEALQEISNSKKNLRRRDIDDTSCSPCTWKMNCGGGCLVGGVDIDTGKPPYCNTNKRVYNYLAKKMPDLIKKDLIKPVLLWLNK